MEDSGYFDKWADDYDESIEPFLKQFPFIGYYELLAAVQTMCRPVAGVKILDVGIGTGLLSAVLAKEGGRIYGVDFSEKMLAKAAERIPDAKLARADIARDHFGQFNSEKFDCIISSYVLHHLSLDQKIGFFRRTVIDNLAPGGKIIIGDIGFKSIADHDTVREKWKEQWDFDEYYMIGEEIIAALKEIGIPARYQQVSECAGMLIYER